MSDKVLHLLELMILLLVLFIEAGNYIKAHNLEIKLQQTAARLEREMAETEARCQRIADTCIDIIANKRWE